MTHEEIISIKETIGHWANNCGGCETCEREFGGKEEPTFDMQTVYEICAAYAEAIKMLEEMANALEILESGYTGMFGSNTESPKDEAWRMTPRIVSSALNKYREFKEWIK